MPPRTTETRTRGGSPDGRERAPLWFRVEVEVEVGASSLDLWCFPMAERTHSLLGRYGCIYIYRPDVCGTALGDAGHWWPVLAVAVGEG